MAGDWSKMIREFFARLFLQQATQPWRLSSDMALTIGNEAAHRTGLPADRSLGAIMSKTNQDGRRIWYLASSWRGARWEITVDDETGVASSLEFIETR